MAASASGTPTSNGIPTITTSVDAPDGVGINSIVAALDTLITSALKTVWKKAGLLIGTRRGVNFIDGNAMTVTVADDAANDAVNVTLAVSTTPSFTSITYSDGSVAATAVPMGLIVALGG